MNTQIDISKDLLWCIQNHFLDELSNENAKKHTLIDCIKYNLFAKIKKFGLSNAFIEKISQEISTSTHINNISCTYLEKKVLQTLLNKGENGLIKINASGSITTHEQDSECIIIDISSIIKETLPDIALTNDKKNLTLLSDKEETIINHIRNTKFHTVSIKKNKEKQPYFMESQETIATDKRIIELLKDTNYQNIEIKQDKEKIAFINRTIKTKL